MSAWLYTRQRNQMKCSQLTPLEQHYQRPERKQCQGRGRWGRLDTSAAPARSPLLWETASRPGSPGFVAAVASLPPGPPAGGKDACATAGWRSRSGPAMQASPFLELLPLIVLLSSCVLLWLWCLLPVFCPSLCPLSDLARPFALLPPKRLATNIAFADVAVLILRVFLPSLFLLLRFHGPCH